MFLISRPQSIYSHFRIALVELARSESAVIEATQKIRIFENKK